MPKVSLGYITTHVHKSLDEEEGEEGFVFLDNTIDGVTPVFLGRPWEPYVRVLFYMAVMSNVVVSAGWGPWKNKST